MRRCGLSAENLSRSPMLTGFVVAVLPISGRESWQRMRCILRLFCRLPVMFGVTALCYRSVSSGQSMTGSRFHFRPDVSLTGRGGCNNELGKMTRIFGIRRFDKSICIIFCQMSISDRASFRNGSWQMVTGVTRPGLLSPGNVFPDKSLF